MVCSGASPGRPLRKVGCLVQQFFTSNLDVVRLVHFTRTSPGQNRKLVYCNWNTRAWDYALEIAHPADRSVRSVTYDYNLYSTISMLRADGHISLVLRPSTDAPRERLQESMCQDGRRAPIGSQYVHIISITIKLVDILACT